jgi:tryptophanyl-tRNA synthetase
MKKVLLSGIKPTGDLHIGNYFGALRQFVDMQNNYESNVFIADYHALTSINDENKHALRGNISQIAVDYLAAGLDPKKVTLFQQSDVPQVTELCWIFNCITTMPYLMRAHAFKDAEAKNKEINVGVFDYPVLMAADILLANADVVPVGKDQQQHVEIARDLAEKFNRMFGETFKIPKAIILDDVATVPGIDGQKMSKSYGNVIPLFATDEEIEKAVMKIPTDSVGMDDPKSTEGALFKIHKLFLNEEGEKALAGKYQAGISYKDAKEALIADIKGFITPMRNNRAKWENNPKKVQKILDRGGKIAEARAEKIMKEVRKKIGVSA